jgi:hypothetical protein
VIRRALALILMGCSASPKPTPTGPQAPPPAPERLPLPRTFFAEHINPTIFQLKERLESLGATQDQPPAALEIQIEAASSAPQTLSVGAVPMGPPAWIGVRETEQGPAFRVLYAPNGLDDGERATLEQALLELMKETTAGPPDGDPAD